MKDVLRWIVAVAAIAAPTILVAWILYRATRTPKVTAYLCGCDYCVEQRKAMKWDCGCEFCRRGKYMRFNRYNPPWRENE